MVLLIGMSQSYMISYPSYFIYTVFLPNKVSKKREYYLSNIEEREEGGTPAIVESIRAGLAFQLKQVGGCVMWTYTQKTGSGSHNLPMLRNLHSFQSQAFQS